MKNILVLLIMLVCALSVSAQTANGVVAFVNDTTTNAETEYLVIDSPRAITLDHIVSIFIVPTNASGTATVTAMPQISPDNVSWFNMQAAADTVNNAGTAANKHYTYANAYGQYYRVKLVSIGTGVTNFTGSLLLKRK